MSTKQSSVPQNKRSLSGGEKFLTGAAALFFLIGLLIFGWYGLTHLQTVQKSEIHSRQLQVAAGNQQCTLEIPAGTLLLRHPSRAAVGSQYGFDAEVTLESPFRFVNCENGIPNWNINVEAQTTFVGSDVKPHASIRQPGFDRTHFAFNWTFMPEETVPEYQSHFWLRVIITQKDQTVENWNLLVRDFPLENSALLGQTAILWFIIAGFSLLLGVLFLILLLQKRHKRSK